MNETMKLILETQTVATNATTNKTSTTNAIESTTEEISMSLGDVTEAPPSRKLTPHLNTGTARTSLR